MYDVSVVIPTFRRPRLLEKTASSVAAQSNALKLAYEIIIVDNSPEKSAENMVDRMIGKYEVPIRYISEPQQNIALARNAGIDHSQAEFIAMIDDDERAPPDWLNLLVTTIQDFDADVVLGPTTPIFEKEVPKWFRGSNLFDRGLNIPTGMVRHFGASANFLMRSATCMANNNRFDPALGRSGGSDTDFFMRLTKSMGRKIVWCNEAIVEEFIPENRLKMGYLLRREFRGSQVFVWCLVRYSDHPMRTAAYQMFVVGFGQITIWLIPGLLWLPFRTAYSFRAKRMLARGVGRLFWSEFFRFNFY